MTLRNAFGLLSLESTQQAIRTLLGGRLAVGNSRKVFRDGFANTDVVQPNPANWEVAATVGAGHIIEQGGDAGASTFLRISLSPFDESSGVRIISNESFRFPFRVGFGVSLSQRVVGQEFFVGAAAVDPASLTTPKAIATDPDIADVNITGNITIASNVATIPAALHGLKGGDRVMILGSQDRRMNVGPVTVTVVDRNTITVPLTLANGTYTATGGRIVYLDYTRMSRNAAGVAFDTTTVTQGVNVTKRNGSRQRSAAQTMATTDATRVNTSPFTDPFASGSNFEVAFGYDEVQYRTYAADSNAALSSAYKWSQGIPDEEGEYRLLIRARNLGRLTRPIARIVSAAKSGTTTATIVTDVPHGLATGDLVQVYGVQNQAATGFANLATPTAVTVVDATSFTLVMGTAATVTSSGGAVILVEGSTTLPGALTGAVQSISAADGILSVTNSGSWAGLVPGELVHLWGLEGAATAYEGAYRVARTITTTLELLPVGTNVISDIASTPTGGTAIKRTDLRVHFVRVLDHYRHTVEVTGGRGNGTDQNNAVPVTISQMPTVTANVSGTVSLSLRQENAWTTTNLGAGATYTGTAVDLTSTVGTRPNRSRVMVAHTAGLVPATLVLQESSDGTTYRETTRQPIPSDGQVHTFEYAIHQRYHRYLVINGGTAQTLMYLYSTMVYGEGPADMTKILTFPLSVTVLAAGASFTGTTLDLGSNHNWTLLRAFARSDQLSATPQGLIIEQSSDGTTFYPTDVTTVAVAGGVATLEAKIVLRYVRVRYVNGATLQTAFLLQAALVSL